MIGVCAGPVALVLLYRIPDSGGLGIRPSFRGLKPERVVRDRDGRLPTW